MPINNDCGKFQENLDKAVDKAYDQKKRKKRTKKKRGDGEIFV